MSEHRANEVLIVEDEWLVRMELVDAFEAIGFVVLESASAEQAEEMLQVHPHIALLVTDIRLAGGKDGWELARQARVALPDLPVIYLSANPPESGLIVAGGQFIDKPAMMAKVTDTARKLLDGKA